MTNKYITKENLIQLLDDAIENEIQKPTEETDMEFVTECEHLINALMGNEHDYSDKDAERYFAEIMKKKNVKKNTIFIQSKRVIAASIAVFIILLGGITLYAFNPTVRDLILKTLNLEIGQTISEGGVTYTYLGETTKYDSIEALIEAENLDILYPRDLPEGVYAENIYTTESKTETAIKYTESSIGLLITHNVASEELPNGEEYLINGKRFIVSAKKNIYQAYTIVHKDLYLFRSTNMEVLLQMMNSLE